MQNFSAVYEQTLTEFQSLIVPKAQADAAKGQVNMRAGLKCFAMDRSIGFVKKNPGQVQHAGVGVDVLMSNADGSWDDYLTDVKVDGNDAVRRITVAYTPHPAAGAPPFPDWVQPTLAHVAVPGPLQLKSDVGPGPGPEPAPEPPSSDQYDEIIRKLDAQMELILGIDAKANALAVQSNNNTAAIQKQIHDLVEDVEETMKQILPVIACRYAAGEGGGAVSGLAGLLGGLLRRSKPPTDQP